MKPLRQAGHSHSPRVAVPSLHPPPQPQSELGATKQSLDPHFPAQEAEPSSPMGSHRGRRNRNIRNLILHSASSPADVHSQGFLQQRLCWEGEYLQLKLPPWQRPHCRCNYKAKIPFPTTFGVGFFIALLWFCHTDTSSALLAEGTRSGWSL